LCHQIFEYLPARGMLQILWVFWPLGWPYISAFPKFRAGT
jgi:hypothetical protein